jgi:signal transduction histidine kinase
MQMRLVLLLAFWIAALAPLVVLVAWPAAEAGETNAVGAPMADRGAGAVVAAVLVALATGGLLAQAVAMHIQRHRRAWAVMLAQASHDLRTPLGAMLGFAELMAKPDLPPPAETRRASYLEHVRACGAHLLALVEDLGAFGRAAAGREALAEEAFAVHDLLAAAALLVTPQAERRAIAIALDDASAGAFVRGDQLALRRALGNLLANAVTYTHAGDRIVLSASRAADGGIELAVRDHGPGIARNELARIVAPFRRGGAAAARGNPGSGLGLSIVAAIARAHGGALRLASLPGQGVRATIALPRARVRKVL